MSRGARAGERAPLGGPRAEAFRPRPFLPAAWLPGPHAQTIAGRVLRPADPVALRRERLDTPDGDFLDLDFTAAGPDAPAAPLVVLLHGLEGSARRGYALGSYRGLTRLGLRAVGLNFRSCSGEPNRTARFYHSGETEDLRFVLARLRERFPDAPLGAIGFSLGGNVLLKYLGEEGDAAPSTLSAAAAVSVPYDLARSADLMAKSFMGRFYTSLFLRTLREKAAAKEALLRDRCDLEALAAARTFREFDDAATAPLHGFRDAADYYRRSSCAGFVERIRVPTLLLQAADDPFLPVAAFPRAAAAANPLVTAVVTPRGGHVGFIGGTPWRPVLWAEAEAARFLAETLAGNGA